MALKIVPLNPATWTRNRLCKRRVGKRGYKFCATGAVLRAYGVPTKMLLDRGAPMSVAHPALITGPLRNVYWGRFMGVNDRVTRLSKRVVVELNEVAKDQNVPFRFVWDSTGGK